MEAKPMLVLEVGELVRSEEFWAKVYAGQIAAASLTRSPIGNGMDSISMATPECIRKMAKDVAHEMCKEGGE